MPTHNTAYNDETFSVNLKAFLSDSREDFYDSAMADKSFRKEYHKEQVESKFADHVIEALGGLSGRVILDVGSGSGWQAVALAMRGALVHGVEPVVGGCERIR
jgi:protein-L-isoaspartate O-methyltransferase